MKTRMRPCVVIHSVKNVFGMWKEEDIPATFHRWGIVAHATTMSTVAIVEMGDGSIRTLAPQKIRFIKESV
jgi:hypothetical protein